MQIVIDTREHKSELQRIEPQLNQFPDVKIIHSKLYVGDYQSFDNPRLCIDRKKDLFEICSNVTQQHERFRAELIRAREAEIKLIVLCEHGEGICTLADVFFWHNARLDKTYWTMQDGHPVRKKSYPKAVEGHSLYKSLCTIKDRYNVDFVFCNKDETGKKIYELLGGGNGR